MTRRWLLVFALFATVFMNFMIYKVSESKYVNISSTKNKKITNFLTIAKDCNEAIAFTLLSNANWNVQNALEFYFKHQIDLVTPAKHENHSNVSNFSAIQINIIEKQSIESIITDDKMNELLSILNDSQRLKYYMGKWYDYGIFMNQTMSIDSRQVEKWSIFDKSKWIYNYTDDGHLYARRGYTYAFYELLNLYTYYYKEKCLPLDFNKSAYIAFGDQISKIEEIPHFVKVRQIPNNYPIPLKVFRQPNHWKAAENIISNEIYDPEWNKKLNKVIFINACNRGPRERKYQRLLFVDQYFNDSDLGEINCFSATCRSHDPIPCNRIKSFITTKRWITKEHQLEYKYIISIEGNDIASNLNWILASNSCLFMPKPTCESWAMEGLLKPYVHYIPLIKNETTNKWNLKQQFEYCLKNDNLCNQIAQNGKKFLLLNKFMDEQNELQLQMEILNRYCLQNKIN